MVDTAADDSTHRWRAETWTLPGEELTGRRSGHAREHQSRQRCDSRRSGGLWPDQGDASPKSGRIGEKKLSASGRRRQVAYRGGQAIGEGRRRRRRGKLAGSGETRKLPWRVEQNDRSSARTGKENFRLKEFHSDDERHSKKRQARFHAKGDRRSR